MGWRPLLIILVVIFLTFLFAGIAQAASLGLSSLSIYGSAGSWSGFSFSPSVFYYELELDRPQRLTFKAQAGPEQYISSNAYERSLAELEFKAYVEDGSAVHITVADDSGSAIYELRFFIADYQEPEPEQPVPGDRDESPGDHGTGGGTADPESETPQAGQDDDRIRPDEEPEENGWRDEPEEQTSAMPTAAPVHLSLRIGSLSAFVNGSEFILTAPPYIVSYGQLGYTMVPVRFIAEALGATVDWEPATKTVGVSLAGRAFTLVVGQPAPGSPVPATLLNGRAFVPLRYVMENFGAVVSWEAASKSIEIRYFPR